MEAAFEFDEVSLNSPSDSAANSAAAAAAALAKSLNPKAVAFVPTVSASVPIDRRRTSSVGEEDGDHPPSRSSFSGRVNRKSNFGPSSPPDYAEGSFGRSLDHKHPFSSSPTSLSEFIMNDAIVIKNLNFNMEPPQLHQLLSQNGIPPSSIEFHYDPQRGFRGVAFVKYPNLEEASRALTILNETDYNGRRLRAEYKRKGRESRANSDAESVDEFRPVADMIRGFYESTMQEFALPSSLSSVVRKQVHALAEKLGLQHATQEGVNGEKFVLLTKKNLPESSGIPVKANNNNRKRNQSIDSRDASSPGKSWGARGSWSKSSMDKSLDNKLDKLEADLGGANPIVFRSPGSYRNSLSSSPTLPSTIRQPKGPDGTKGFAAGRGRSMPLAGGSGGIGLPPAGPNFVVSLTSVGSTPLTTQVGFNVSK
eukprot:GILK01002249.1.p1 GENE.GILK01002249.1~~GILK01002249.1.p1  ORF type:complete len:447 (+),score=72.36 GILK01002249.1:71-1342(+)